MKRRRACYLHVMPVSPPGDVRMSDTTNCDSADKGVTSELSLTPTLTALLRPTADYLGTEIKNRVSEKIEEVRERRRAANLLTHIGTVSAKTGLDAEVIAGSRQLDLFQEWMEGAQDIPPQDKVLSEMWEGLLVKILKGIDFESKLLYALSALSESDAALLLKFSRSSKYRPKDEKERYQLRQPQFEPLVETSRILHILDATLIFVGFCYMMIFLYFESVSLKDISDASVSVAYGVLYRFIPQFLLLLGSGATLAFLYRRLLPTHRLTWFGAELLNHVSISDRDLHIIETQA